MRRISLASEVLLIENACLCVDFYKEGFIKSLYQASKHNIQEKKTGLLLAFCCYAGGFVGNASKKELVSLIQSGA